MPEAVLKIWEARVGETHIGLFAGEPEDVKEWVALRSGCTAQRVLLLDPKVTCVTPGLLAEYKEAKENLRQAKQHLEESSSANEFTQPE